MMRRLILATALVVAIPNFGSADPLFTENFETGLLAWTGKLDGAHSGEIVVDPLLLGNHVLHFKGLNSAGDIFTKSTFDAPGGPYTLEFDYLGMGANSGGFIAWTLNLNPVYDHGFDHYWLGGMAPYAGLLAILPSDNLWHHVVIDFPGMIEGADPQSPFHLALEDFVGSDAIAGNAYFDNIVLGPAVPEPSALLMLGAGLTAAAFARRRRS